MKCTPTLVLGTESGAHLRHGPVCSYEQVPFKCLALLLLTNFCCDLHCAGALLLLEVGYSVVEMNDALIWQCMKQCVVYVAPMGAAQNSQGGQYRVDFW